jgi:ribose/xylose/arabinose/galactoside ABC-type transport system permease subunit
MKIRKCTGDILALWLILIAVIAVMILLNRNFLRIGTFEAFAFQIPEIGLLTLSMMITMVSGGINLSCVAGANLSSILMAVIMTHHIPKGGENSGLVLTAIVMGLLVSILAGLLNGWIIAYWRVPPILTTLGVQMLLNGICLALTGGRIISGYPKSFLFIGNGLVGFIPVPFVVFVLCALFISFIIHKLPLGTQIYMYGSNPTATEFSAVNTRLMILKTYALSGFLSGVAAVLLSARFNSAAAGYGESYLLQAVLIAVLGGINPNGGSGRVLGVVLALGILQVVASGINLLRISPYLTMALWGGILLVVGFVRTRTGTES